MKTLWIVASRCELAFCMIQIRMLLHKISREVRFMKKGREINFTEDSDIFRRTAAEHAQVRWLDTLQLRFLKLTHFCFYLYVYLFSSSKRIEEGKRRAIIPSSWSFRAAHRQKGSFLINKITRKQPLLYFRNKLSELLLANLTLLFHIFRTLWKESQVMPKSFALCFAHN
jgi:hypothetical protein